MNGVNVAAVHNNPAKKGIVLPNKEERLLVPPLLRTVRESFPSYGSSISSPFPYRAAVFNSRTAFVFPDDSSITL